MSTDLLWLVFLCFDANDVIYAAKLQRFLSKGIFIPYHTSKTHLNIFIQGTASEGQANSLIRFHCSSCLSLYRSAATTACMAKTSGLMMPMSNTGARITIVHTPSVYYGSLVGYLHSTWPPTKN